MTFMDPDAQAFVERMTDALAERSDFGMAELMDQVLKFLHIEAISIFMLDRATDELVCRYAAGPVGQQVFGLRIPVGQGVVGWVVKYEEDLNVPSTCLQCNPAPCAECCPVDAFEKNGEMGIYQINGDICEGCGACYEACEFQMVVIIEDKAMKCDLCGGEPTCVRYCPTGALVWEPC